MKAQVATAASCESRMLLKTISCIGRPQLGTGAANIQLPLLSAD